MSEKVIVVKSAEVKTSDSGKDWISLIDEEDKTHRIFGSVQDSNGGWVHLEDKVDMLKDKIEAGEIQGLPVKLTKDKVGKYWNIVAVELVKDVFVKQALEKIKEEPSGQEVGLWWKELGLCIREGALERDYPNSYVAIKVQYYQQMFRLTGIKLEGKGEIIKSKDGIPTSTPNGTLIYEDNAPSFSGATLKAHIITQDEEEIPQSYTKEDLFKQIRERLKLRTDKAVLSFIVNKCKIDQNKIDEEPGKTWEEIKKVMGWF